MRTALELFCWFLRRSIPLLRLAALDEGGALAPLGGAQPAGEDLAQAAPLIVAAVRPPQPLLQLLHLTMRLTNSLMLNPEHISLPLCFLLPAAPQIGLCAVDNPLLPWHHGAATPLYLFPHIWAGLW